MQRLQGIINWVCVASELSHFFCCVLPIIFSILSLLSGFGLMAAMPSGVEALHEMTHDYERPLILVSASILCFGWVLHYVAYRMDCRTTGCSHEPCAPSKRRSGKVLIIATILFAINLTGYIIFHH